MNTIPKRYHHSRNYQSSSAMMIFNNQALNTRRPFFCRCSRTKLLTFIYHVFTSAVLHTNFTLRKLQIYYGDIKQEL